MGIGVGKNGIVTASACSFEECCKSCTSEEEVNVFVTTKNNSGRYFALDKCVKHTNEIIKDNHDFPVLAVKICLNDWDALEKNYDIEYIEMDPNVYNGNV